VSVDTLETTPDAKPRVRIKATSVTIGPPTIYSDAIAVKICNAIAEGRTLRQVCDSDHSMPHRSTVFRWLAANRSFELQYRCARRWHLETRADEIIEIADNAEDDLELVYNQKIDASEVKLRKSTIPRATLAISARQWLLSKEMPRRYGDKPEDDKPADVLAPSDPAEAKLIETDQSAADPLARSIEAWRKVIAAK
jgi:hypothetical protein